MSFVPTYIIASFDPNGSDFEFEIVVGDEKLREYAIERTLKHYGEHEPFLEEVKDMKIDDIINSAVDNNEWFVAKVTGDNVEIEDYS
uniref:Uncharacterized protein n=1 Tax=Pithovirus LCPAC401 TaxID=2506595 RepID=A0A481ZBP1_9VIRU|nr:MAG: hypothetical protein LCPAC401_01370 [Pithovirus LCPAC401]